jgi:hypothetical protein
MDLHAVLAVLYFAKVNNQDHTPDSFGGWGADGRGIQWVTGNAIGMSSMIMESCDFQPVGTWKPAPVQLPYSSAKAQWTMTSVLSSGILSLHGIHCSDSIGAAASRAARMAAMFIAYCSGYLFL